MSRLTGEIITFKIQYPIEKKKFSQEKKLMSGALTTETFQSQQTALFKW